MYTADQLMPKRFNNPFSYDASYTSRRIRWIISVEKGWACPDLLQNRCGALWYIDIPDAPDEIEPWNYPLYEWNEPLKEGWYIVHTKTDDGWRKNLYRTNINGILSFWVDDDDIDFVIPYCLEELRKE